LDKPVEFEISQKTVEWNLNLQSGKVIIKHDIPAVILSFDNGQTWNLPPFNLVRISDLLYYDHILLKNGAHFVIPLAFIDKPLPYFSSPENSFNWFRNHAHFLEHSVKGEDRGYDVTELRKEAIKSSENSIVKVYYSGSETEFPMMLFQISCRNKYSIRSKNDCIIMNDISGAKAIARYSIGEKVLKEVDLEEGNNNIELNLAKGFLLTILEYDPITDCYDLKRTERVIGEEVYCTIGCDGVYVVKIPEG
jgi:hypothetical protein